VTERNREVDTNSLVIDDQNYKINRSDINNIVSNYNTDLKGFGLVIIVESLNKPKRVATMHATFFNIQSKEIVFTKELKGKPSGFWFSSYWQGGLVRGFRSFNYKQK
jgi:hypothetical protein